MKSNYKLLGDYIREVNVRNTELKDLDLLGISIQKEFIQSIANTIGTDMSKYKIVKKNQFAYGTVTSRNGDKISIALLENYDEALISQAYISFEVIDENVLLPEYLMMWFRREEFDRYARYMSYGSAREVFSWDEMCNVKLPIPSIEKQREIVKEYNTILNRIKLNENIIKNLDFLIQGVYKKWFVEFNFPNEFNLPYNDTGGEFKESELERIPIYWEIKRADEVFDISIGKTPSRDDIECFTNNDIDIKWISIADIKDKYFIINTSEKVTRKAIDKYNMKIIPKNTVIMSFKLTVGRIAITTDDMTTNEAIAHFKTKNEKIRNYLYCLLKNYDYNSLGSSSSIGNAINSKIVKGMLVLIPDKTILYKFNDLIEPLMKKILLLEKENINLGSFKKLLLLKLANMGE
ncbi:restriction endonuclease subunit S [Clostridium perfringens]|uniref:restriction endonuclease subunit S n=1 Tax=Clostridium perfringens TaxID=1502 RepID=UPI002148CF0E|nr:restriction endonuclease subunit S [Clostridium perfringens]UUR79642.1 restriction endonuclease subunit S [Clostridium perfringens]